MYKYETHCHTSLVSACAPANVKQTVEYYKKLGYDGIFITNHFLDGNINVDPNLSYKEKIEYYFGDYEQAAKIGNEIGIKVFDGVEISYKGTDFLIYGLHKEWYLKNEQIMDMKIRDKLSYMRGNGAYIVQAHPFREANYIDHIRLFPYDINAVEIINAHGSEVENNMARYYAQQYKLKFLAGTDNHLADGQKVLAGVSSKKPISSVEEFIFGIQNNKFKIFKT